MARSESLIYNGYTIGGSTTGSHPVSRFSWSTTYERATVSVDFVIHAPAGTLPSVPGTLQALCDTAEAALKTPRAKLEIKFDSTTLKTHDPASAVATGFNARPKLTNLGQAPNSATARLYRFECEVELPANLSGQDGRQSESVTIHYDLRERRVVTLQGVYTQLPNLTARAAFLAVIDAHATTVLTALDGAATWVLASRDENANDPNTALVYTRVYVEHLSGRRGSVTAIAYGPQRNRTVDISGTYLRTTGGSATANYTASEATHSAAVLAALTTTLVVGTNCELVTERFVPNEQDDSLSFTRVYEELIHQQVPGVKDNADIVRDLFTIAVRKTPVADSPVPGASAGSGAAPGVPGGTQQRPGTGSGSVVASSGGTQVVKPVELAVRYECFVVNTVTDLRSRWESTLRGHMLALLTSKLGKTPSKIGPTSLELEPRSNRIVAQFVAQVTESPLLAFRLRETTQEDLGKKFTPVLSGKQFEYIYQQGFATKRRIRAISCEYVVGGGFDPVGLLSSSGSTGWVLTGRSTPDVSDEVQGVAGEGVGQITVRFWQVFEEFLYVASVVRQGGIVAPPGGGGNGGGAGGGGNGAGAEPGKPSSTGGGGLFVGNAGFGIGEQGGSYAGADISGFNFGL